MQEVCVLVVAVVVLSMLWLLCAAAACVCGNPVRSDSDRVNVILEAAGLCQVDECSCEARTENMFVIKFVVLVWCCTAACDGRWVFVVAWDAWCCFMSLLLAFADILSKLIG